MTHSEMIAMLLALAAGTMLCRFLPLMISANFLAHPILQKLNRMLPLAIMVILVLSSLDFPTTSSANYSMLIAQILAMVLVLLSYRWFNNMLLSVACGIAAINGILYFL